MNTSYKYVTFEIHNLNQTADVLKCLYGMNVNCEMVTNFEQMLIKFKICLDDCDTVQLNLLKKFLVQEDVYNIHFS